MASVNSYVEVAAVHTYAGCAFMSCLPIVTGIDIAKIIFTAGGHHKDNNMQKQIESDDLN